MFKLIFDKDKINFFISNLKHKGGDFKNGPALHSHFMFVNSKLYKSKKCIPYQSIKILPHWSPSINLLIKKLVKVKTAK